VLLFECATRGARPEGAQFATWRYREFDSMRSSRPALPHAKYDGAIRGGDFPSIILVRHATAVGFSKAAVVSTDAAHDAVCCARDFR